MSEPAAALFLVCVAYVAFHYFASARVFAPYLGGDNDLRAVRALRLQRVGGFVVLGVLPALVLARAYDLDREALGLGLGRPGLALAFVAGTALLVLPILARSARSPKMWAHYPQLRVARWTPAVRADNALGWALYLAGYELFFRGVLFFAMHRAFGAEAAVAITTALYAFAHLPKPASETIGSIPMGVVFCLAALHTGAIWAPFVMHTMIALASERFNLRAQGLL